KRHPAARYPPGRERRREERDAPGRGTPLKAAVITVSTKGAAGARADESGPAIREALEAAGIKVVHTKLVSDGVTPVGNAIREASQKANVIITSGGTGLSPNDQTPEATRRVIDREAPGIAEALRAHSLAKTPHGMLSRAVAGTIGQALVVNLPGSPRAARESPEILIPVLADGMLVVGANGALLARLASEDGVAKVSTRDLAPFLANGPADGLGATTVAATVEIASRAGIEVFATGGIGGVHRGAERTMDVSADLRALARFPVVVVCAGAKLVLDLAKTLEQLETLGVPVVGFGTAELPGFYARSSGLPLP